MSSRDPATIVQENFERKIYALYNDDAQPSAPMLPEFDRFEQHSGELARSFVGYHEAVCAGLFSAWRAAAEFATSASTMLHAQYCLLGASIQFGDARACRRDAEFCEFAVSLFVGWCQHWIGDGLSEAMRAPITASHLDDSAIADALEVALRTVIHPSWWLREPALVDAIRPTILIASPITRVGEVRYSATKKLTHQIAAELERSGYLVETPSDFVAPENREVLAPDEFATRAALHRAAIVILFADDGRIGTAITWTLAEELGIPTLILHGPQTDVRAARFPGLETREIVEYHYPDDAVRAVGEFVTVNRRAAMRRAAEIAAYRTLSVDHISVALMSIDPLAFEDSTVSYMFAKFYVADPVNWFQARRGVAVEILRVLQLSGDPSGDIGSASPADAHSGRHGEKVLDKGGGREPLLDDFDGLLQLAEENGWMAGDIYQAWELHIRKLELEDVSQRPINTMTYDAWRAFLRGKGWSMR